MRNSSRSTEKLKYTGFFPELATRAYCSKLVSSVFDSWRDRLERVRELAMFQELVVERGQVAVMRRAFQRWKFCIFQSSRHYNIHVCMHFRILFQYCQYLTECLVVSLQKYQGHLLEWSSCVSELSLKRRAFLRLRLHCQQKQRKRVNKQIAAQHSTKQVR